jgi:hypothetical protein
VDINQSSTFGRQFSTGTRQLCLLCLLSEPEEWSPTNVIMLAVPPKSGPLPAEQ